MVKKKQRLWPEIVILMLLIAALSVVWIETEPGNPSISVAIDPRRGDLNNVTISCYQCVPNNRNVWEGNLAINGKCCVNMSDPSGASVAMTLEYGAALAVSGASCPGYQTNSTCVIPLKGPLPFTIGLNLQKTSTGGLLKMIVYWGKGNSFVFQTASGGLSQTVTYEAISP